MSITSPHRTSKPIQSFVPRKLGQQQLLIALTHHNAPPEKLATSYIESALTRCGGDDKIGTAKLDATWELLKKTEKKKESYAPQVAERMKVAANKIQHVTLCEFGVQLPRLKPSEKLKAAIPIDIR